MISLDQVYLLEQKVESAVEKIQQLQAENDALRNKCTELTNALSAKSEQLSTFESDQSQIESGIKKALDRLNSIENSVLKTASQVNKTGQAAVKKEETAEAPAKADPLPPTPPVTPVTETSPSFDTMDTVPEVNEEPEEEIIEKEVENIPEEASSDFADENFDENDLEASDDDNHDGLGFDIF